MKRSEAPRPADDAARARGRRRCARPRGRRRSIAPPTGLARRAGDRRVHVVRHVLVLQGDERDELPGAEVRAPGDGHRTTSTPATALDTHLASSVWRRCSERAAARRRTARSRRRTSSSCGARTPARRIRSSSTTCSRACTTARGCSSIDPRRTSSAQWADRWLGLDVGTDIALSNTMAREIIHAGLHNRALHRARDDAASTEYAASVEPFTLEEGERAHRRAGRRDPRDGARVRARRPGDDLLDARHHRAPQRGRQRPLAHQPRACCAATSAATARASTRCAARTTCRAAATWARSRTSCPGFQDIERDARGARPLRGAPGASHDPRRSYGWHLTQMFDAMERGELRTLYVIGENPAQSEADINAHAQAARGARLPDRAGHRPHEDGRDGRRRASRRRRRGARPRAR